MFTHVGIFFDRHVELLLQLSHGADSFRKLLHVPPVEHATVHCVVVHVLAYPADLWETGGDRRQKEGGKVRLRTSMKMSVGDNNMCHVSPHRLFLKMMTHGHQNYRRL